MKKRAKVLIVCSLLFCFYSEGYSQDYYGGGGSWRKKPNNDQQSKDKDNAATDPSGYISINLGFATPEGSFGEMLGSQYGNYADPGGLVFDFSLGVPINHSNFGVALMFGSYDNTYDVTSFASNNQVYSLPTQTGQTDYSESSIMGGLYVTYPIGRLSIDGRLMGGILLCTLPEQSVGYNDQANNSWYLDTQPVNQNAFAVDAGIGARFLIAELGRRKLCLMANIDYLYSNVSYNTQQYVYETYASGVNAGTTVQYVPSPTVSGHLPIQLMNITFGIGYQL